MKHCLYGSKGLGRLRLLGLGQLLVDPRLHVDRQALAILDRVHLIQRQRLQRRELLAAQRGVGGDGLGGLQFRQRLPGGLLVGRGSAVLRGRLQTAEVVVADELVEHLLLGVAEGGYVHPRWASRLDSLGRIGIQQRLQLHRRLAEVLGGLLDDGCLLGGGEQARKGGRHSHALVQVQGCLQLRAHLVELVVGVRLLLPDAILAQDERGAGPGRQLDASLLLALAKQPLSVEFVGLFVGVL